jgi:hypothetical protein
MLELAGGAFYVRQQPANLLSELDRFLGTEDNQSQKQ